MPLVILQDPPPFFPPIPPEERRPIRVLGLFDGIATGLLVLKELGVELERYVASEIDQDAIYVSKVQHNEIIHVGCIEGITEKEVRMHLHVIPYVHYQIFIDAKISDRS